ncbi:MAG: anthranilate synthase component I family protein [bacterium]|nr:anthranilate synthase component I family protein [bacterium]
MNPIFIKFKYKDCNPVNIYSKLGAGKDTVVLDSGDSSEKIARWSFIGMDPFLIFRSKNNRNEIIYYSDKKPGKTIVPGDPLTVLKQLFDQYKIKQKNKLPPFFGGLAGFFSYDFVNFFEKIPRTTVDDAKNYDCYFLFVKTVVAIDKLNKEVWAITNIEENGKDAKGVHKRGMNILKKLKDKIVKEKKTGSLPVKNIRINSLRSNYTFSEYKKIVEKTKKYIKSGDIYQANLSQRFKAKAKNIDPFCLYQKLRKINPSPFACFLNFSDVKIISSSPERLIKLSGKIIETRPIAGTRPRGKDDAHDKKMEKELILNEKERAEHIMLVDLERNDLGRVCKYNSIKVDELMVLEKYSHVIHIVSNVRGELQKGKDAFDCIRACFPGGTITGVPKVRCMGIIDELEKHRRGPYTGSAGYISFNGDMDLNILIRTFVLKDDNLYFQVGGGIVADSVPSKEYEETLHKAEALMEAIGVK